MDRRTDAARGRWTSLAALLLVLLFAAMADGLMEALGLAGFALAGVAVMGAAWGLTEITA